VIADAAAEVAAMVAEVLVADAEVTADVTEVTGDVTGAAADPTAEVTFDVGKVAACACREDSRRRIRIPAAAITTCTTRRAMRRTIGCGIAAPAWPGQTRLGLYCPPSWALNHHRADFSWSIWPQLSRVGNYWKTPC
jgi:hypothetical protein